MVIATKDRERRLEAALASLRAQTIGTGRFEVLVVDDGSSDGTPQMLEREAAAGDLALRIIRRPASGGPGAARNEGWRAAVAPLVAFIDDDCVADPRWLEAGLEAWGGDPARFVQGPTTPIEEELDELGPTSYTIDIRAMVPEFPTCNIFYPRALLERIDGFDEAGFPVNGEDTDLAWRAREAGAEPTFAPDASVRHAVVRLGPIAFLRRNWSWNHAMRVYARHPQLRRERIYYRVFWNLSHWWLVRLWLALALPWRRELLPLKLWLGSGYIAYRLPHPRTQRRSLRTLAWFALVDTVEIAAVARGSLRNGILVL